MNIQKRKLAELEGVYSTTVIELEGKRHLVAASENREKKSFLFSPPGWELSVLFSEPGGVMNIVQTPGSPRLLSITGFYPIFQSENAEISEICPAGAFRDPWKVSKVLAVPFVHRIGLIECADSSWLLSCALCESKAFQEDWSRPGSLFISPVEETGRHKDWKLKKIFDGLTKNHGLFIHNKNQAYVTAEEGIFLFDFSGYDFNKPIEPVHLSKTPTSDIFIDDIDNDGNLEAGTIEPFHGNAFALYRLADGAMIPLYRSEIDFGHVAWIGRLFGYPSAISAGRGGDKALILYQNKTENIENGQWEKTVIDSGTGATQISVFSEGDTYCIFAANHGIGEIALYTITP